MSEAVKAVILGVVQGIAEFLPISSSGHLVIAEELLGGVSEGGLEMNIALHVGTLFSILVVLRTEILKALKDPSLVVRIVVATLPLVVVGLAFKDSIDAAFDSPLAAGFALMGTAALLLVGQKLDRGSTTLQTQTVPAALVVGLFQAVALIPGISRSGSTIAAGLSTGLKREDAARFSFLIAIPAIGGAAVMLGKDLFLDGEAEAAVSLSTLLIGMATAFVVGCVSLHWLLRLVSARKLHWFAWYCGAVGLMTVTWQTWFAG